MGRILLAAMLLLFIQPARAAIRCDDRTCTTEAREGARNSRHASKYANRYSRRTNRNYFMPRVRKIRGDQPTSYANNTISHEVTQTHVGSSLTQVCAGGECGTVASSVASQFTGLFQDLKAMGYRLAPGCYSPRGHMPNSLHHWGGACDLFGQYARDLMSLPHPAPSEQIALAAKHGLVSGCEWGNRDCGHFDVSGYHGGGHVRVAHRTPRHARYARYARLR